MKRRQAHQAASSDAAAFSYDELPTYLGFQVRRTQMRIFSEFETALKDFGFTPGSFGVLTLIRANRGITQVTLAAAFAVDKSTINPVIVRLEKRGLVRREVLASDRRCHALFLSVMGEEVFRAARAKVREFEQGIAARLTGSEQKEFSRLLLKLQQA